MVDDFLATPMRDVLGQHRLGRAIFTGVLGLFRPQVALAFRHEIENYVQTGQTGRPQSGGDADSIPFDHQDGGGVSLAAADGHLGFRAHALKSIRTISQNDGMAQVELILHNANYNRDLTLDVRMRQMDGYWQLVDLSNFPEFCSKLAELQADHLQNAGHLQAASNNF